MKRYFTDLLASFMENLTVPFRFKKILIIILEKEITVLKYSDSLELLPYHVPNSSVTYFFWKTVIFQTQYKTPYFEKFLICLY